MLEGLHIMLVMYPASIMTSVQCYSDRCRGGLHVRLVMHPPSIVTSVLSRFLYDFAMSP